MLAQSGFASLGCFCSLLRRAPTHHSFKALCPPALVTQLDGLARQNWVWAELVFSLVVWALQFRLTVHSNSLPQHGRPTAESKTIMTT